MWCMPFCIMCIDGQGKGISCVFISTSLFTILYNIIPFNSFLLSVEVLNISLFNMSVTLAYNEYYYYMIVFE